MDDLVSRCLQADEKAWESFVQTYGGMIWAAVRKVLQSRGAAGASLVEDVVQDLFLRLIENDFHLLKNYDPRRASLRTWLNIVSRSTAIDWLRRKRLPTVRLEEMGQVAAIAESPQPEHEAVFIQPGLLTGRQKLILHLLFDGEMSPEEIGKLLGISAQTVRSTKHKAVQKLREYFGRDDPS